MGDFTTLVRFNVLPPIRPPAPARPVAPPDEPEQGVAVLGGSGGALIDLPFSETQSWSKQILFEVERHVNILRINQVDEDGEINPDNYIDVEETQKMIMEDSNGVIHTRDYTKVDYAHAGQDNVEILERDVIKKNPEAGGSESGGAAP